jgi:hypothetical protein
LELVAGAMTAEWVVALDGEGLLHWFDRQLTAAGTSVLFGARPVVMVRGGVDPGICMLDDKGLKCATDPLDGFVKKLGVANTLGRGVVCPDGFVLVATADGIHVPTGDSKGKSVFLPVPIDNLPEGLGPIVHGPSGAVAVPVANGTAVRLLLPLGNNYDLTTMRHFDVPESELPGGVLGMALSEDMLYVAARDGKLVAVQLNGVPDSTDGNWSSRPKDSVGWTAGPVVSALGDVLVMDKSGNLLRINQGNKVEPTVWTGTDPFRSLHATPGGGVGGLGPASTLMALAPAEFYPWLQADTSIVSVGYALPGCQQPLDLHLGTGDGRALVVCPDALRLTVPPAPTDAASPWPTVHGPGGSGCYVGK